MNQLCVLGSAVRDRERVERHLQHDRRSVRSLLRIQSRQGRLHRVGPFRSLHRSVQCFEETLSRIHNTCTVTNCILNLEEPDEVKQNNYIS
jgi:hypothetical protein